MSWARSKAFALSPLIAAVVVVETLLYRKVTDDDGGNVARTR